MLNSNRLLIIINLIQMNTAEFKPKMWNDEPYYKGALNWCQEKIGTKPQNLLSHVLNRINAQILIENLKDKKNTYNEVTEENYEDWQNMASINQAARWLGLNKNQGFALFAPEKHQIPEPITRTTTLRVLKNLLRTRRVNWHML